MSVVERTTSLCYYLIHNLYCMYKWEPNLHLLGLNLTATHYKFNVQFANTAYNNADII